MHINPPDFTTICTIEKTLGISLWELAEKLAAHKMSITEMTMIIALCNQQDPTDVGKRILCSGIGKAVDALAKLFTLLLMPAQGRS